MSRIGFRLLGLVVAFCGAAGLRGAITVDRSVGLAQVREVASLPAADLVVLDGGFEAGFRQGMVCTVTRGNILIGELLLVDLRARVSSALILDLTSGQGLQPGDRVAVKTVSSRK